MKILQEQFVALKELLETGDEAVVSLIYTSLQDWGNEVSSMQSFNLMLKQKVALF